MIKTSNIEIGENFLGTLDYLKEQRFSSGDIIEFIADKLAIKPIRNEITVPVSIFKNSNLSVLESIVKYLRENLELSFGEIASLTNRNEIALAVSYRNAKRKFKFRFIGESSLFDVPILVLQDRKLSVLENVVSYLKDQAKLNYHQIAVLLNRNDRTIWTVYQRGKRKRG